MIIYASRTGNVRFIINQKLNLPSKELREDEIVNEDFIIFTYTDKLGELPEKVDKFMKLNHPLCKGVIASGNKNFGKYNFCRAADILNELYGIEIIDKLDLRGNDSNYEKIKKRYNEIFS